MVLPPSSADLEAGALPGWLTRIARILHLGRDKVIVLVTAGPGFRGPLPAAQLRRLTLALLEVDEQLVVATRASDLETVASGALVLLVPRGEDAPWLERNRPLFAERKLRVVLWADADVVHALSRHANDFLDWISHTIECPAEPADTVPAFTRAGLDSAPDYPGIAWHGSDLVSALEVTSPGVPRTWHSVERPYDDLIAYIERAGEDWLLWTDANEPRDLVRLRWALAETDPRGRCILDRPGYRTPGWWPVSDACSDLHVVAAELEPRLGERAALLAILLELEPAAIELARDLQEDELAAVCATLREHGDPGGELARYLCARDDTFKFTAVHSDASPTLRGLRHSLALDQLRSQRIALTTERLATWSHASGLPDSAEIPALDDMIAWVASRPAEVPPLPAGWPSFDLVACWLEATLRHPPGQDAWPESIVTALATEHPDVAERWSRTRGLRLPSHAEPRPAMPRARLWHVPPPPRIHVPRAIEAKLVHDLVHGHDAMARRHGIVGMPGTGKTTLAAAVARNPEIAAHFPDGVYWMGVGTTWSIVSLQTDLARAVGVPDVYMVHHGPLARDPVDALFSDDRIPVFADNRLDVLRTRVESLESRFSLAAAASHEASMAAVGRASLQEFLASKRLLLVLDEISSRERLDALDVIGKHSGMLVTARDPEVFAGKDMTVWELSGMTDEEALELLAAWADTPVEALPPEATEVTHLLHGIPAALVMAGSLIHSGRMTWRGVLDEIRNGRLGP